MAELRARELVRLHIRDALRADVRIVDMGAPTIHWKHQETVSGSALMLDRGEACQVAQLQRRWRPRRSRLLPLQVEAARRMGPAAATQEPAASSGGDAEDYWHWECALEALGLSCLRAAAGELEPASWSLEASGKRMGVGCGA